MTLTLAEMVDGEGIGGLEWRNNMVLYLFDHYSLGSITQSQHRHRPSLNLKTLAVKWQPDMGQGCLSQPKAVSLSTALSLVQTEIAKFLHDISVLS